MGHGILKGQSICEPLVLIDFTISSYQENTASFGYTNEVEVVGTEALPGVFRWSLTLGVIGSSIK